MEVYLDANVELSPAKLSHVERRRINHSVDACVFSTSGNHKFSGKKYAQLCQEYLPNWKKALPKTDSFASRFYVDVSHLVGLLKEGCNWKITLSINGERSSLLAPLT
jgi:hypothetical protein